MTLDADSDGWYYDPRREGLGWTYGKEIWCNLQGRYTYIVADLSHLPDYTMRLCQLGIMGTEYIRSEEIPTQIELEQGTTTTLAIPHITSAFTIGNILQINMRQKSD